MKLDQFRAREWESEFANDFAILRNIPSAHVRASIATIKEFPSQYPSKFLERLASGSVTEDERTQFTTRIGGKEALPEFMPYGDLKMVQNGAINSELPQTVQDQIRRARDILLDVDVLKAPQIRKVLYPHLRRILGAKEKHADDGLWCFPIVSEADAGFLYIDFSQRMCRWGFSWYVSSTETLDIKQSYFSYERLMGLGQCHWDLVTTDTMERAAGTLANLAIKILPLIKTDGR